MSSTVSREPKERLGVIVVNYNAAGYVNDCLDSIFNQSLPFDEVLLVDDSSNDISGEILKRASINYGVRFIRNEINLGLVKTLNKSIPNLTSELVMIVNSDDVLHKDAVKEIKSNLLKMYDKKKIIFFDMIIFGPKSQILAKNAGATFLKVDAENLDLHFYWNFENELTNIYPNVRISGSSVFSKTLFQEVGGFREPGYLPEDAQFFNNCLTIPDCRLHYIPKPLLYYRQHGLDQTNSRHNLISKFLALNDYTLSLERNHKELEKVYFDLIKSKKMIVLTFLSNAFKSFIHFFNVKR
jgi:glycosyltransferase involved in cell wall biosynthesis